MTLRQRVSRATQRGLSAASRGARAAADIAASAMTWFLLLAICGAAAIVAGVFLSAGSGPAFIAAGVLALVGAGLIHRGLT